jgi:hypothetical protein
MKALSFIGLVMAAFMLFIGISTRQQSGAILSNAIIVGGAFIAAFVIIVRIIMFFKEKGK